MRAVDADDSAFDWQRDQPDMADSGEEEGIIIDWREADGGDVEEGELNYYVFGRAVMAVRPPM